MARNIYADAMLSQGACNLGALVHALDRIVTLLQDHAHECGLGTDWVNEHPAVRLFAHQILHLSRRRGYSEAYRICSERQAEEAPSLDVPDPLGGT